MEVDVRSAELDVPAVEAPENGIMPTPANGRTAGDTPDVLVDHEAAAASAPMDIPYATDYVAPRIGRAYQVTVPAFQPGAVVVRQPALQRPAVQLHAAARSSAGDAAARAAFVEEVGVLADVRPPQPRVGRVVAYRAPLRMGVEAAYVAYAACSGDVALAAAAKDVCLAHARERTDASWEAVAAAARQHAASANAAAAHLPSLARLAAASSSSTPPIPASATGVLDAAEVVAVEVPTTLFLQAFHAALQLFSSIASGAAAPIDEPPVVDSRAHRGREVPWQDAEVQAFVRAIERHGRNFRLIAMTLRACAAASSRHRTPQHVAAWYYGNWRRLPSYEVWHRRKNCNGDLTRRLEKDAVRRERAWFHFWRFDEDALGPALPPAAVQLPLLLQDAPVPASVPILGDFALPLITPAIDVLVKPDGTAMDAVKHAKASSTPEAPTGVTTRSSRAAASAAASVARQVMQDLRAPLENSDPIRGAPMIVTAEQAKAAEDARKEKEAVLKELNATQHVDPLADVASIIYRASNALVAAAVNAFGAAAQADAAKLLGAVSKHAANGAAPAARVPTHSTPHIFSDSWIEDRILDNESYCGNCGDGGDMICCDGPCRRSFHVNCLKQQDQGTRAGIRASPSLHCLAPNMDYEADDWRCTSCATGRFECFICGEAGHDGVTVFRCMRMCGKWYHLRCLANDSRTKFLPAHPHGFHLPMPMGAPTALPAADASLSIGATCVAMHVDVGAADVAALPLSAQVPPEASVRFVCPFHTCSGCSEPFDAFHSALYLRCHACPTAYHEPCLPADAIRDMADIVTCSNKAAHDSKKMSSLYKGRSGVNRTRGAGDNAASDHSALERRRNLSGRSRIGDALDRKLASLRALSPGASSNVSAGAALPALLSTTAPAPPVPTAVPSGRTVKLTGANKSMPPPAERRVVAPTGNRANSNIHSSTSAAVQQTAAARRASASGNSGSSHLVALSEIYKADIHRRARLLVEAGVASWLTDFTDAGLGAMSTKYVGVKTQQGARPHFSGRVSMGSNVLHLGTFQDPLEAAVAFDYATTFYRGTIIPRMNFPGMASDCRVEPPIDPWPEQVRSMMRSGVMKLPDAKCPRPHITAEQLRTMGAMSTWPADVYMSAEELLGSAAAAPPPVVSVSTTVSSTVIRPSTSSTTTTTASTPTPEETEAEPADTGDVAMEEVDAANAPARAGTKRVRAAIVDVGASADAARKRGRHAIAVYGNDRRLSSNISAASECAVTNDLTQLVGVYSCKKNTAKWYARVAFDGGYTRFGPFGDAYLAARGYDAAVTALRGAAAVTNFSAAAAGSDASRQIAHVVPSSQPPRTVTVYVHRDVSASIVAASPGTFTGSPAPSRLGAAFEGMVELAGTAAAAVKRDMVDVQPCDKLRCRFAGIHRVGDMWHVRVFMPHGGSPVLVAASPCQEDAAKQWDRWNYAVRMDVTARNFPMLPPRPLCVTESGMPNTHAKNIAAAYRVDGALARSIFYRTVTGPAHAQPFTEAESVDALWATLTPSSRASLDAYYSIAWGFGALGMRRLVMMSLRPEAAPAPPAVTTPDYTQLFGFREAASPAELAALDALPGDPMHELSECSVVLDNSSKRLVTPFVAHHDTVVVDVGAVPMSKEDYPPIGWKATRTYTSMLNPRECANYTCTVLAGSDAHSRQYQLQTGDVTLVAESPAKVWLRVDEGIHRIRVRESAATAASTSASSTRTAAPSMTATRADTAAPGPVLVPLTAVAPPPAPTGPSLAARVIATAASTYAASASSSWTTPSAANPAIRVMPMDPNTRARESRLKPYLFPGLPPIVEVPVVTPAGASLITLCRHQICTHAPSRNTDVARIAIAANIIPDDVRYVAPQARRGGTKCSWRTTRGATRPRAPCAPSSGCRCTTWRACAVVTSLLPLHATPCPRRSLLQARPRRRLRQLPSLWSAPPCCRHAALRPPRLPPRPPLREPSHSQRFKVPL